MSLLTNYDAGYQKTSIVAGRKPLPELQDILVKLVADAISEFEWGAIDAITDLITDRHMGNGEES